MVKNSTLFFFYDNRYQENELLTDDELIEPERLFQNELNEIFAGLEFSPAYSLIDEILAKTI
jgi:hypothetical protein